MQSPPCYSQETFEHTTTLRDLLRFLKLRKKHIRKRILHTLAKVRVLSLPILCTLLLLRHPRNLGVERSTSPKVPVKTLVDEHQNFISKEKDKLVTLSNFDWEQLRLGSVLPVYEHTEVADANHTLGREFNSEHSASFSGPVVPINHELTVAFAASGTIACHFHAYYLRDLEQYKYWLRSIPYTFDLFVSSRSEQVAEIRKELATIKHVRYILVKSVPNCGSELGPMSFAFGVHLQNYDFVVHLHTKCGRYDQTKASWSAQLGHHLFYSPSHFSSVMRLFSDPRVGLVFPPYFSSIHHKVKQGSNFTLLFKLGERYGTDVHEKDMLLPIPLGSFFVARTKAIKQFFLSPDSGTDLIGNDDDKDGITTRALEQMFPVLLSRNGFISIQVHSTLPFSLSSKVSSLDRRRSLVNRALEDLTEYPRTNHLLEARHRVVIFSCSTRGYDSPQPHPANYADVEYVFFTDSKRESKKWHWRLRPLIYSQPDQIKSARMHKTSPHKIFNDKDLAIWIDSNIMIRGNISPMVREFIASGADFGTISHPYRRSVKEEVIALKNIGKEKNRFEQVNRYLDEGYPDSELTETNFLLMNLKSERTRATLDEWSRQIQQFSSRDQLSFDYACWKFGASKMRLPIFGLSVRSDARFLYVEHGAVEPDARKMRVLSGTGETHHMPSTVIVVITICGDLHSIEKTLRSVDPVKDGLMSVILVNDGTDLRTLSLIEKYIKRYPQFSKIVSASAGKYSESLSDTIKSSAADYVVLFKSDIILPSGWAQQLVIAGESDPTIGAISPLSNAASCQSTSCALKEILADNDLSSWTQIEDVNHLLRSSISLRAIPYPVSGAFCLAVKRKTAERAGVHMSHFMAGNGAEVDACFRLKLAGLTCAVGTRLYVHQLKPSGQSPPSTVTWGNYNSKYASEVLDRAIAVMKYGAITFILEQFASVLTTSRELAVKPIVFFPPQVDSFAIDALEVKPKFHIHGPSLLPGSPGGLLTGWDQRLCDQVDIAKKNGLYGLALSYYHNRSSQKKTPIELVVSNSCMNVRYFYCWDIEDSSRGWDAQPKNIFASAEYLKSILFVVIEDFAVAVQDPNYITVKGDPVFVINSLAQIPELATTLTWLRETFLERTGRNFILGTRWCLTCKEEWENLVDFVVQSPLCYQTYVEELSSVRQDETENQQEAYLQEMNRIREHSSRHLHSTPKLVPGVCLANMTTSALQAQVDDACRASARKHSLGLIPDNWMFVDMLGSTNFQGNDMLQALLAGVLAL